MLGEGNTGLAIALVLVGVVLLGLTPLLLRRLTRRKPAAASSEDLIPVTRPEISHNENAVFLVLRGGKVGYMNDLARQWFGIGENETPNLERMSRHARPADAFFSLCAVEGNIRFSLDHNLVEGNSYAVPYQDQAATLVTLHLSLIHI